MKKTIIVMVIIIIIVSLFLFFARSRNDESQQIKKALEKANIAAKKANIKEAESIYKDIISQFSKSNEVVTAMRQLAYLYQDQNDLLKAREIYKEIINKYPQNDAISQVQQDLWQLNIDILFSGFITDNSIVYEVRPGDTLSKIARQHHTTVNLIKKNNDLKSDIIRPQDRLKVVTADFSILVDKSQNTLTLKASNDIIRTYSVSTGKDNHTPTGEFEIVNKLEDPVWYKAGAIVPADSPENILGSRWMGISQEGYGIHGTTDPETLGQQITAGCIRMSNKEVEELFTIVPRGTKVTIVD